VQLAPGVEYPRDVLADLLSRLRGRGLTVAQVRDELGTSRRYAAPLLEAAEREDAAVRG
jgi:orotate phosphoribosyltransferase-like protein